MTRTYSAIRVTDDFTAEDNAYIALEHVLWSMINKGYVPGESGDAYIRITKADEKGRESGLDEKWIVAESYLVNGRWQGGPDL